MADKEAGPVEDVEWVDALSLNGRIILPELAPGDREDLNKALAPLCRKATLCDRMEKLLRHIIENGYLNEDKARKVRKDVAKILSEHEILYLHITSCRKGRGAQ